MEYTRKRVTKVIHRKMIFVKYKPKIQHKKATIQLSSCSKCCLSSRTCVLSLQRQWSTALSRTLCFTSASIL